MLLKDNTASSPPSSSSFASDRVDDDGDDPDGGGGAMARSLRLDDGALRVAGRVDVELVAGVTARAIHLNLDRSSVYVARLL